MGPTWERLPHGGRLGGKGRGKAPHERNVLRHSFSWKQGDRLVLAGQCHDPHPSTDWRVSGVFGLDRDGRASALGGSSRNTLEDELGARSQASREPRVPISDAYDGQLTLLADRLDPWLKLFDAEFASRDMRPPERPLEALFALMRHGSFQIQIGDEPLDLSKPVEHVASDWFRIVYDGVLHWYERRFGAEAMRQKGIRPLDGAVMIRGVAFGLAVPAHRSKVEQEGETAWLYFDDDVGPGENPELWIKGGPNLATLEDDVRSKVNEEARVVAGVLRFVEYRRATAGAGEEDEAVKLVISTSTYLQQAARRIVSGESREFGPAWFDLQMAVEASLKAVLRHLTGKQPRIHDLAALASRVRAHDVTIDDAVLDGWPDFGSISDWRYGQGEPWGLARLYAAYRSALKVAQASLAPMPVGLKPGFGLLLRYPAWLQKPSRGS